MQNNMKYTNRNGLLSRISSVTIALTGAIFILALVCMYKVDWIESFINLKKDLVSSPNGLTWTVYQNHPLKRLSEAEMNRMRIMIESDGDESKPRMHYAVVDKEEQDRYVMKHGDRCHGEKNVVWQVYQKLSVRHQSEVWKYCVLYNEGGVVLDGEVVLLKELKRIISDPSKNYAVLGSSSDTHPSVHSSSLIRLQQHSPVASHMIRSLVEKEEEDLDKLLYNLILADVSTEMSTDKLQIGSNGHNWFLSELSCPIASKVEQQKHCTLLNGYCCHVSLAPSHEVHLLVRNPSHTIQQITPNPPQNPYVTQITYQKYPRPLHIDTPNMFHLLMQNDCLPTDRHCHKCLRSSSASKGSCSSCLHVCHCYCQVLCQILPEPKFVAARYTLRPPIYTLRPFHYPRLTSSNKRGLIPPIIHQTWFEPVSRDKYPNMSRLIRSFQLSGLQYKFYDDKAARDFLATHFPPEVKEAYDALLPGAFKADLFRYCALLIHGGIYADMDVLLQTNLHTLLTQHENHDIAFLMPIDEPGANIGHRMCLWNGFIASKPGHPILAKVIEIVVNNIRNRFTGVDYDTMFCPTPMLSVSHTVDMLLTTGPCILGYAINTLLHKHPQSSFSPGQITSPLFPGRTILLDQNKNDMGAHRFTFLEQNIIVAATDMPEYEDRANQKTNHYSKTRVQAGVYGLDSLYSDDYSVDEEIRLEFA